MKTFPYVGIIAFCLFSCNAPTRPSQPDAGPDTSCGLDCANQEAFGLIINRCFEYSSTSTKASPPELGVWVRPVETLEGGVQVLPVDYREGGQIRMTDFFAFRDGALKLMRRSYLPGQSVTYKNEAGEITGVSWVTSNSKAGENVASTTQANRLNIGGTGVTATNYRVIFAAASPGELKTPLKTYESGLQLVFTETPDHGVDTRRIWVPKVGFVQFSSPFSADDAATSKLFLLQGIRDIQTGSSACGIE